MRNVTLAGFHRFSFSMTLAVLGTLAGLGESAHAQPPVADYAFAQQKVYGMSLSLLPGSTATLSGTTFSVATKTAAVYSLIPGTVAYNGGLDSLQSLTSTGTLPAPPENFSGNVPTGYSNPDRERVLLQSSTTPWGPVGTGTVGLPTPADIAPYFGQNYARADAYATPNPDNTVAPAGSGTTPANVPPGTWPLNGLGIPMTHLINSATASDLLSLDTVAESLLTDSAAVAFGTGDSEWTVSGEFTIAGGTDAVVSYSFNMVERLVAYNSGPLATLTTARNLLSFDVKLDGVSVFGPLGTNPSTVRILEHPNNGFLGATFDRHTDGSSDIYPGPVEVVFRTPALSPGVYTFAIVGSSSVDVNIVPEPAANVTLALGVASFGMFVFRRGRSARRG